MAGAPPVGPELLSPDGRWRWDGARWVPNQTHGGSSRRSHLWIWIVAGVTLVLVFSAIGAGYWAYTWVQGFLHGTNTCLPSDFPRYPGSMYANESFDLNGPAVTCHVVLESNDDAATVTAFFQKNLNTGPWRATPHEVSQVGTVNFQPAHGAIPFGTVQVASTNTHTEITIDTFNSTCLPLNFPLYPRAEFGGQSEGAGGVNGGCRIVFVTNDQVAAVTTFYERALSTGNWLVDSSSAGKISWRLRHGKRTDASGTVMVAVVDDRTHITIDSFP